MAPQRTKSIVIDSFNLPPGRVLANKYEVLTKLGSGWEGEVYKVRERNTGIERAAKLFFPQRNPNNRSSNFYARKLHRLRHCPILIQYHAEETITFRRVPITLMLSEYVEGQLLSHFLSKQRGKRLAPFPAMHLLHSMAKGVECIHREGEYHGDLHSDNVIVSRYGLEFEVKLFDTFYWHAPKRENLQEDVVSLVHLFYESLGGAKHYAKQPEEVRHICRGLKRSLILKRFPTVTRLRQHLENMTWS